MSKWVLAFSEIGKNDVASAGGKGANLGEMTAAGIAVPQGFVVTTESYRQFLQENGLVETVQQALVAAGDDESRLLAAAEQFRVLIRKGRMPAGVEQAIREAYVGQGLERVAVRSSATAEDLPDASYAGQQETYLNVRGIDAVIDRVRDCYASLWGGRAVCYRRNHGYDQTQVALAVVIQEMIESETAGVLFTVNPVNRHAEEMQINASYGLGESVVSGRVTADSYVCDRSGRLLSCMIGSKATEIVYRDRVDARVAGRAGTGNAQTAEHGGISTGDVDTIAEHGDVRTENGQAASGPGNADTIAEHGASDTGGAGTSAEHGDARTGNGQAAEHAASGTGNADASARADADTLERPVSDERRAARCLSDTEIAALCKEGVTVEQHYGMPMDIEWAIRGGRVYILQARAITTLGDSADHTADDARVQEYLKDTVVKGPQMSNLSFLLEKMPYAYYPLDYDYMIAIDTQKGRILGENGLVLSSDPQMDDDGVQTLPSSHIGVNGNLIHLPGTLRELKDYDACAARCREFMPRYESQVAALAKQDLPKASLADCGAFLHESWELVNNLAYDRFRYALFPSFLSSKMRKAVRKAGASYTQYDLYRDLNNKTALVSQEMAALAEEIGANPAAARAVLDGCDYVTLCQEHPSLALAFQAFLDRNGFKSDYNCYCLIARTFREDPDRLLQIVRPLVKAGQDAASMQGDADGAVTKKDYATLQADLQAAYGSRYPALAHDIENYRYFHVVREESQYLWETIFYYVRQCVRRINTLLTGSDDLDSGAVYLFRTELEEACRRGSLSDVDRERITRRGGNHDLSQKVWDASKLLVFTSDGDVLKGNCGSAGSAVGPVCVIHGPEEFYKMRKGDILVCELTDPEWTPLFSLASAVVADTGAALSHAAIVAREYGIPAVLGVGYATTRFRDGDMIRVDGDKGEVSRV